MRARIYVTLKKAVLDPQGKAVARSLSHLGFGEVKDVRIGKFVEVDLDAQSRAEAERRLGEMCKKLIANTVIEDYRIELEGGS
jgi:phosphoribosylformylglycinamidine synthase